MTPSATTATTTTTTTTTTTATPITLKTMQTGELLTILTIVIALSAYLATIRLAAIEKIKDPKEADRKWEIKKKLGVLTLADAPLVISGLCLGLYIFWQDLSSGLPPSGLLSWSVWLFAFAGVVLALLHGGAWIKTLWELIQGKDKPVSP